jgi:hypothetical protein
MPGRRDQQVALLDMNRRFYSLCNILLLADPDIIRLCLDSLQELFESDESSWSTDDVRVQCQSHHLWFTLLTFGKQDVQGVVEMFEEIVWTRESGRIDKLVIVTYIASASIAR